MLPDVRAFRSDQGAAGQKAAIHHDAVAINDIRCARDEESNCTGYVASVTGSSSRDHCQRQLLVLVGDLVLSHLDETGSYRVHADPVGGEFLCPQIAGPDSTECPLVLLDAAESRK